MGFEILRSTAATGEIEHALTCIIDRQVLAVAIDGPLRKGFDEIGRYRTAERVLTSLRLPIGKPGQSNSPNGRKLNAAANRCARYIHQLKRVGPSVHDHAIHTFCIVEAFPAAFLGLLLENVPSFNRRRGKRSDFYFEHLIANGTLVQLFQHLLPGRQFTRPLSAITNHDDRAALICALTALCVAGGRYAVAGDEDGWIVLPPTSFINAEMLEHLSGHIAAGNFASRIKLQLGSAAGRYPSMSLEEFNASDKEIEAMFYADPSWEPKR